MAYPSDLEKIIMSVAADLDHISSLNSPLVTPPVGHAGAVLLTLAYGDAAAVITASAVRLSDHVPPLLFTRWAGVVVTVATRWERGEPLAMAPFQSIARDCVGVAAT